MKKLSLLTILLALVFSAQAQVLTPIKWSYEFKKVSATEGQLVITADIEAGWHLYSQYNPPSKDGLGGAQPLSISATSNPNFELVGKAEEPPYKKEYNDIWESDEYFFTGKVVFKQKVKIMGNGPFVITGKVEGQTCKDMCIPTGVDFTISVK